MKYSYVRARHRGCNMKKIRKMDKGINKDKSFTKFLIFQLILLFVLLLVGNKIKIANKPLLNYISDKMDSFISKYVDIDTVNVDTIYKSIKGEMGIINFKNKTRKKHSLTENINAMNSQNVDKHNIDYSVYRSNSEQQMQGLFIVPVNGLLSSPFGERMHPIKKIKEFHKGIDIEANKGTNIKASVRGEVDDIGNDKTFGNYIKLSHNDNISTLYAHCDKILVKKGQNVEQGDIIGKVGNTGRSSGAHLHFEIWKDGRPYDPITFIDVISR